MSTQAKAVTRQTGTTPTSKTSTTTAQKTATKKAIGQALVRRHVETHISARTGSAIYIACPCAIGQNHDYEAWRVRAR